MIVIVDYNIGNVGSIKNMITKMGFSCVISRDHNVIKNASKLILSGVGSFDNGINNLNNYGLVDVLTHKVLIDKTPILGICLGMQLMAERSDEGFANGLGWIPVSVKKIEPDINQEITIPVIGWNYVQIVKSNQILCELNQRFYFVHSYYFPIDTPGVIATAEIGFDFCAAFQVDNIFGVQFHPEKSHKFGKALLINFCNL
jgi:imidazole glycerol-phosphate synthase subunit HisH